MTLSVVNRFPTGGKPDGPGLEYALSEEDQNLNIGTILVGRYKGLEHRVEVARGYRRIDTNQVFTSLSKAGSDIMNGISCNGWRFFSVERRPGRGAVVSAND